LVAGDLFTTICAASAISDDIAYEVYKMAAAFPSCASSTNKLATRADLDNKIDNVMVNGAIVPNTTCTHTNFVIGIGNDNYINAAGNSAQKTTEMCWRLPSAQAKECVSIYKHDTVSGCLYMLRYGDSDSSYMKGSLPFVLCYSEYPDQWFNRCWFEASNMEASTSTEWDSISPDWMTEMSGGWRSDPITTQVADLGNIASESEMTSLTNRVCTIEQTTIPDLCSCVEGIETRVCSVEGRVCDVEDILNDASDGLTGRVSALESGKVACTDYQSCCSCWDSDISTLKGKPGLDCVGTVTGVTVNGTSCTVSSAGVVAITDVASAAALSSLSGTVTNLSSCPGLDCTGTLVPSDLNSINSHLTDLDTCTAGHTSSIANLNTCTDGLNTRVTNLESCPGLNCVGNISSANFSLSGTNLTITIPV
jgi:hypothetical protein